MEARTQAEWDTMVAESTHWDDMTAAQRAEWTPTMRHEWASTTHEEQARQRWEDVCARPVATEAEVAATVQRWRERMQRAA